MAPSQPRQPLASCLPLLLLLLLLAGTLQPARACLPEGAVNAGVTQGKPTHVCIVASPLTWTEGTNNFSRVAFLPNTDRFSRLNFTGSKWLSLLGCLRCVCVCALDWTLGPGHHPRALGD